MSVSKIYGQRPPLLERLNEHPLHPHQVEGIRYLVEHNRCLLADDVGLGKTVQALGFLAHLASTGELAGDRRVLLVAPAGLHAQWRGELRRFVPEITHHSTTEGKRRPVTVLADATAMPLVEITTPEMVRHHEQAYLDPGRCLTTVIVDEIADSFRGGGAEWRATLSVSASARRVVGLTATPIQNHLVETWHLLALLGLPGLPSRPEFEATWVPFEEAYQLPNGRWVPRRPLSECKNEPVFRLWFSQHRLRRTAAEVGLTLPRLVEEQIWVPLAREQVDAYAGTTDITDYRRRSTARRRAGTQAPTTDGANISASADVLLRLLTDPNRHLGKAVIFSEWTDFLHLLDARLTAAGLRHATVIGATTAAARRAALNCFRDDPAVRYLLGTAVLEAGLNLQHAETLISVMQSYNPAREEQRVGRLRRLGSPHARIRHTYVLPNTPVERRAWGTRQQKSRLAELA